MIVVEHRPPLKRIEIGPKPAQSARTDDADSGLDRLRSFHEQQRIWRLIEQASQGQGSVEE